MFCGYDQIFQSSWDWKFTGIVKYFLCFHFCFPKSTNIHLFQFDYSVGDYASGEGSLDKFVLPSVPLVIVHICMVLILWNKFVSQGWRECRVCCVSSDTKGDIVWSRCVCRICPFLYFHLVFFLVRISRKVISLGINSIIIWVLLVKLIIMFLNSVNSNVFLP